MTFCRKWMIFLFVFCLVSPSIIRAEKNVRDYLTTGGWYPRSPERLNGMLEVFFSNAAVKPLPGKIVGLIAPHAGLAYSGQCAAKGYKQLERLRDLERVILLGLSHRGGFYGAVVSDFENNSTPLGKIPVDTEITAKLAKEKYFKKNNLVMQHEHSLETHLPFLQFVQKQRKNKKFKIVPILFGYLERKDFKKTAAVIKKYITGKTLVIASTDLTHYGANFGYTPFRQNIKTNLTQLDMGMINHITQLDFGGYIAYKKKTGITMCGFAPVGVLLNIFHGDNPAYKGTLIDYCKSGDRENDYTFSVSYAAIAITASSPEPAKVNRGPGKPAEGKDPMKLSHEEKKILLSLARQTLEGHFQGKSLELQDIENKYKITPPLKEKAGVFVTLKKNHNLRGCIGSIIGRAPLYEGVRNNALKAAFSDPRFRPLGKNELGKIDMEISVMTPLQKIEDYKKIRLGTDGVIIKKGYYQAVYLPQVATETGWGLDGFLGSLCRKAGLPVDAYKSGGMDFYIFQAQVFDEEEVKK